MSYPYGSSAQKDAYDYNTRPYEAPQPSRLDSYQTNTVEPYSAGNSRNRLNEDNGLRYRDEYQRNADADWDASREKPLPAVANTSFGAQKENFAEWRKSHKEGGAWTRGSGLGCTCRFFFCSLLIFLFLLLSIVLTIVVYVRPPDVQFGSVDLDTDAPTGAIERTSTSITIHLKVPIIVENPNFFDAGISKITATAFYPISGQDVEVGGGNMTNVVFKSGKTTTINFPLSFEYSSEMDPTGAVLQDLMARCGVNGGQRSDLPIKYTIKLDIKILIPTFSPSFSGSANFACPLDASDLSAIGGVLGNVKKRGDSFLDRALARFGL